MNDLENDALRKACDCYKHDVQYARNKIKQQNKRISELEGILQLIIAGNDLAAERNTNIKNWPGSYLSTMSRKILKQSED